MNKQRYCLWVIVFIIALNINKDISQAYAISKV